MPTVVNGIGTWYYGKSERVEYHGTCTQCQAETTLASYDTRLWFVIVFIPIIPLGRKHVLDECASCQQHMSVPMDDWLKAVEKAGEAQQAYDADPLNKDKAMDAVGSRLGLRDLNGFRKLAPAVEAQLGSDPEVLAALASVHCGFGDEKERERLLRRAHEGKPDDEIWREALANCLLDHGNPDEAKPLLAHIEKRGIPDKVWLLLRLAEHYQMRADHQEALRLFDAAENIEPRLADDETFKALHEASRSRVGTAEPVMPNKVAGALERRKSVDKVLRFAPAVIGLIVGCWALVAWMRGNQREVWLVNGLREAYSVTIAGATHRLEAGKPAKVTLKEGRLPVTCDGAPAALGPQELVLETPFWTRPFSSTDYVVNPDRTALLRRVKVVYGARHNATPPSPWYVLCGLLTPLDGVDHLFEDPPRTVYTKKRGGETRDVVQLEVLHQMDPDEIQAASAAGGRAALVALAQTRLRIDPADLAGLGVIHVLLPPEEQVKLFEPGLAARPINMDLHRMYQDAMIELGRDAELQKAYERMLAAESSNAELRYLAARTEQDPVAWERKIRELAAYSTAPVAVVRSLTILLMTTGQFAEALDAARRYAKAAPKDPFVVPTLHWSLLANGKHDEALAALASARAAGAPRHTEELALLGARGREAEAKKIIAELLKKVTDKSAIGPVRALLEGFMLYGAGREKEAGESFLKGPYDRIYGRAAVMKGDLNRAVRELASKDDPEAALATWLELHRNGGAAGHEAAKMLEVAVKALRKGHGRGGRIFADALEGKSAEPVERVMKQYLTESLKPVVLAVLGVRNPAFREQYFALARTLNVSPHFPHLTVQAVVGGGAR